MLFVNLGQASSACSQAQKLEPHSAGPLQGEGKVQGQQVQGSWLCTPCSRACSSQTLQELAVTRWPLGFQVASLNFCPECPHAPRLPLCHLPAAQVCGMRS